MANISLAGQASTNSRGKRPLPPGAVSARTLWSYSVRECVRFEYADGHAEDKMLLSWVIGQAGLLWGSPRDRRIPHEIQASIDLSETPGSYGHVAEWALADALGAVYDGHLTGGDMSVRFFQSGGEACAAAARVARKATGRELVASSGYHGAGAEWAHLPNNGGLPLGYLAVHEQFAFGDTARMQALARRAACIMVEVPAVDEVVIRPFLLDCRQVCDANGIPLIIDDVVGGFRLALAGSCERYGVKADMVTLGKAMSATGCVAAVLGRADLVNLLAGDVFFSTTFGGSPGPCAVAEATVRWLTVHRAEVFGENGHLYRIGKALQDGYNALGIRCVGQPERSIFQFDTDSAWLAWCGRMIESGIMCHRPNFPTLAHTAQDVKKTLEIAANLRP